MNKNNLAKDAFLDELVKNERVALEKKIAKRKEENQEAKTKSLEKKRKEKSLYEQSKEVGKILFFIERQFPETCKTIELDKLPKEKLAPIMERSQKYIKRYLLRLHVIFGPIHLIAPGTVSMTLMKLIRSGLATSSLDWSIVILLCFFGGFCVLLLN